MAKEISTHNQPLNLVRIARGLFPEIAFGNDGQDCLEEFLLWPPDLFAFTSRMMSITGCYTQVVSPPKGRDWPPKLFNENVKRVSSEWKRKLDDYYCNNKEKFLKEISEAKNYCKKPNIKANKIHKGKLILRNIEETFPKELLKYWEDFKQCIEPISTGDISDSIDEKMLIKLDEKDKYFKRNERYWNGTEALIYLHAVSDSVCENWGIISEGNQISIFQEYAENLLIKEGTMAHINTLRCRILPKRHTPKVGITLRSMSANLAYHRSSTEIDWRIPRREFPELEIPLADKFVKNSSSESFSILMFPYPENISGKHFEESKFRLSQNVITDKTESKDKYFSYFPPYAKSKEEWKKNNSYIQDAILKAKDEAQTIDMAIFPECAFHEDELPFLEGTLADVEVHSFITGIHSSESSQVGLGKNKVVMQLAHMEMERKKTRSEHTNKSKPHLQFGKIVFSQSKHHRWKIDKYQIERYNIGNRLSPLKDWWEAIEIPRRHVNFINIGNAFTICPLICEDLARQDPIADLIRTVGPTLVVTILMDGPQKASRWSSKYASVLSEDPGSCVITLTSAGMVDRYNQANPKGERIVSLYCDSNGTSKEITLEKDSLGILLTLCLDQKEESIADGRLGEDNITKSFSLGGIKQIMRK